MTFHTLISFGDQAFSVLVLIISAAISSYIAHGYGTRKAKEAFIGLVLLLMLGVQCYHLINAAMYIPATKFYVWNDALHRSDCLASVKGGKRPLGAKQLYDINPCFCYAGSKCVVLKTGSFITNSTRKCPTDGSASCYSAKSGKEIGLYIPDQRNCHGGQLRTCSLDQPCDPCDRELLPFSNAGRCRSCTTENRGDCGAIPGEGPFCFAHNKTKTVVKCTRCCTDAQPLFYKGECY